MKKNLLLSLFAMVLSLCTYAQEVTLDFTTNTWGLPEGSSNKATAAATYQSGDYTITLEAASSGYYFNTQGYLMLGKTDATLTLPAFNFDVEKIVVTCTSGTSSSVTQNIYVGETAVSDVATGGNEHTFAIAETSQAAGTIYTFKVTNNKNTQITKIEVFKKSTGEEGGEETPDTPEPVVITPPTFSPTNTYVANSVEVTLAAEEGMKIYYTTDGTEPTVESTEYTAPFTLSATDEDLKVTVKAIAVDAEGNVSEVASLQYSIYVVKPMEVPEGHVGFDFIMNPWGLTLGSGSGETADAGNITAPIVQNDVTMSFTDGSTPTRMWSNNGGGQLRIYKNGTITITAPAGKVITAVEFNSAKGTFTVGESTEAVTSWTGSETAVTFTCTANAQIKTILVKVEDAPAVVVEAPVITPETGTYAEAQTVTITAAEGFSIFYTLDGTDPSDASNVYEGPFTVSETTTIKAIATNDEDVPSAVTTSVITIMPSYTTIAAMLEDITADKVEVTYTFENLLVMGAAKANVYVHDGTNAFLLYGYDYTFKAGDRISGSVLGQLYTYSGLPELAVSDKWANVTVTSSDNEVVPTVKTIAEVTDANLNEYIRLEEVAFVSADGKNYTFTDGTNNITVRDNFGVMAAEYSTEEKYNINAFVAIYKTSIQIYPLTEDDVELITVLKNAEAAWENEAVEVKLGEAVANKFTTLSDGVVTYTSSNEAVATVDATGAVTVVGYGIATITASVPETATFLADDASFTLTVRSDADGTLANAYLVSDAIAVYVAGDTIYDVWVKGYIVGYSNSSSMSGTLFEIPTEAQTEIVIAAAPDETDINKCFPVQLPKGDVRTGLDVFANNELHGAEVWVYGDIMKYFGIAGMNNTADYSLDGKNPVTGINGIEVEKNAPKGIYTIAGQKVNTITKGGIYIIDGKKTFVK